MFKSVLLAVLIALTPALYAQQVDAYFGFGQLPSHGPAPSLDGTFADIGVNLFVGKQFGVGWQAAWRWVSGDYADMKYDTTFQSFDAIFQPAILRTKRVSPEIRAGVGFNKVHFQFDDQQACDRVSGCPNPHFFQGRLAGAARIYLSDHIFIRPAMDFHLRPAVPFIREQLGASVFSQLRKGVKRCQS
jgi:hypothetical protein